MKLPNWIHGILGSIIMGFMVIWGGALVMLIYYFRGFNSEQMADAFIGATLVQIIWILIGTLLKMDITTENGVFRVSIKRNISSSALKEEKS